MIPAQHTWRGDLVCRFFSGIRMNRYFKEVHLIGPSEPVKGSVLMIANHFSWWDGFIQYRLNKRKLHKRFHVMMLEEQLNQNKILNEAGAFSVRKHSRDVIDSLNYSSMLLKDPGNMVLIFPQGRIESIHHYKLNFEKGVQHLFTGLPEDSSVVLNVNLIDFHDHKKTTLYVYYCIVNPEEIEAVGEIEKVYNEFYQQCREKQQQIWI